MLSSNNKTIRAIVHDRSVGPLAEPHRRSLNAIAGYEAGNVNIAVLRCSVATESRSSAHESAHTFRLARWIESIISLFAHNIYRRFFILFLVLENRLMNLFGFLVSAKVKIDWRWTIKKLAISFRLRVPSRHRKNNVCVYFGIADSFSYAACEWWRDGLVQWENIPTEFGRDFSSREKRRKQFELNRIFSIDIFIAPFPHESEWSKCRPNESNLCAIISAMPRSESIARVSESQVRVEQMIASRHDSAVANPESKDYVNCDRLRTWI